MSVNQMNSSRVVLHRFRNVALAAVAAAMLSACNMQTFEPTGSSYVPLQPRERFPIDVTQTTVKLEVPVHGGSSGLAGDVQGDVREFLYQFQSSGADRLVVVQHPRPRHGVAAAATISDIQRMVHEAGIGRSAVVYAHYPRGYAGPAAPVMLSFDSHIAIAPACGNWPTNLAETYNNTPYPNFGCSAQHNMAAMVADPRDLQRPRGMTAPHAGRRDLVIERYRTGIGTEADTSASEEGTISEVGND